MLSARNQFQGTIKSVKLGNVMAEVIVTVGDLEIVEDDRIGAGGCLVETEAGNVEAQIEKQLKGLEQALIEMIG